MDPWLCSFWDAGDFSKNISLFSLDNYQLYTEESQNWRGVLKKAKRKSWREYCHSLDNLSLTPGVWNMLKKFRDRKLLSYNNMNNQFTNDTEYITNVVNKLCSPSAFYPWSYDSLLLSGGPFEWLNIPFVLNLEFRTALKEAKSRLQLP